MKEAAASILGRAALPAAGHARPALAHRADIDGLRALAVVPVLLFHAGFAAFPGGFVGVDVFFVISGYLITSIILDDIDRGRFSILVFYERRIRRIFPALFAMLFGTLILGTFVLVPDDLKDLGQGAAAATLFASNFLFWQDSGYFDAPAEHNALLHTWSLAVEEQFYIVFPLALLLFRARSTYLLFIVSALLLSFALAVWGVRNSPVSTFYLAPARAWELLVGALLATGSLAPPSRQGLRDALSLLGVGLIAYSVLAFTPQTAFPGAAALVPCLGAGLIIYTGISGRSLAGRILGTPALVFTGLISYSLYLWHWPLLVLARAYAVRELTVPETLAILVLSAAIAAVSWRWIESPFRRKPPVLGRPKLFATAGLVMGVTVALGVGLHVTRGLPQRLPPEAVRLAAAAGDRNPERGRCLNEPVRLVQDGRLCRIGDGEARPSFILWGDSHAEMLRTGLGNIATEAGRTGLFVADPGCPPLLGVSVETADVAHAPTCRAFNEAVLEFVSRDADIRIVVLAAHWSLYATGVRYGRQGDGVRLRGDDRTEPDSAAATEAAFRQSLVRTVDALAAAGKEVVIVGPVPEVGAPVPRTLALAVWRGRTLDIRPVRDAFDVRNHIVLSALAWIEQRGLARVVYPHLALCDEARCRVESNGGALYRDDNHLTRLGVDSIGQIFVPVL